MIMNIPSPSDSTLLWDIGEKIYSEFRTVSTLPRDITNGYVVKFKDTFYMVGGDATAGTALPSYKYVDGEWVEDTVLGAISIYKGLNDYRNTNYQSAGGVVANDNTMYITPYESSSNDTYARATITTYDGTSKINIKNYFGYYIDSYFRKGNVGISANGDNYKTISWAMPAGGKAYPSNSYKYGLSLGSSSGGNTSTNNYSVIKSYETNSTGTEKILQPLCQGVYFEGSPTFLINLRKHHQYYTTASSGSINDYSQTGFIMKVDDDGNIIKSINLPDEKNLVTDMVCINGYIYITYMNGNVYRYKHKWEEVAIGAGSLVEHNGEIHVFTGTSHTARKLYRTAKTYAPKGTKIYLPYETSARTTNLQAIEGGYIVTESGNVELKIYDY